jgi:hypothetical protein
MSSHITREGALLLCIQYIVQITKKYRHHSNLNVKDDVTTVIYLLISSHLQIDILCHSEAQCLQNKTFEKSYMKPRMKVQLSRKTRLKVFYKHSFMFQPPCSLGDWHFVTTDPLFLVMLSWFRLLSAK